MRVIRLALWAAVTIGLAGGGWARAQEGTPVTVRVLTFNIHHGEGTDGTLDLERTARVIREANPDLVALQEVDVGVRRSGGVNQAAELGRLTGMHAFFAKAMDYDGGAYGAAVLSKLKPEQTRAHLLPAEPGHEPRAAAEVTVRFGGEAGDGGVTVRFASTHLEHRSEALREKQLARLTAALEANERVTTVLAGDFNARPASAMMMGLSDEWVDAAAATALPTFPSAQPRSRIDYVLYRRTEQVRAVQSGVIEEAAASDHRPVWVAMEILAPARTRSSPPQPARRCATRGSP